MMFVVNNGNSLCETILIQEQHTAKVYVVATSGPVKMLHFVS